MVFCPLQGGRRGRGLVRSSPRGDVPQAETSGLQRQRGTRKAAASAGGSEAAAVRPPRKSPVASARGTWGRGPGRTPGSHALRPASAGGWGAAAPGAPPAAGLRGGFLEDDAAVPRGHGRARVPSHARFGPRRSTGGLIPMKRPEASCRTCRQSQLPAGVSVTEHGLRPEPLWPGSAVGAVPSGQAGLCPHPQVTVPSPALRTDVCREKRRIRSPEEGTDLTPEQQL